MTIFQHKSMYKNYRKKNNNFIKKSLNKVLDYSYEQVSKDEDNSEL